MASPAVTVQRHDSALGRWEMIRRTAPEALRPHVLGYLGYHEWTPGPFRRLEVPSGEVHVIVSFARILRFQRAATLMADPAGPSLCEIALDCGSYDQAHLNRDFRAFAGRTPTELMAARLPKGGGYSGA